MFLDIRIALYKHIHLCRGIPTAKSVALAQTPVHRVRVKISDVTELSRLRRGR